MGLERCRLATICLLFAMASPPRVTAASALLMDWHTGKILYQKNAWQARHPASLTKILTAILVLERGRLGDVVEVGERATRVGGSRLGLRRGDRVTLEELLVAVLLRSANDAAVAVAEHLGGSVEGFARLMNDRARELGATSSNFLNPHGLTQPGHLSTAIDLALLARHALSDAHFARLVATPEATVGELEGDWERYLRNTNRLLWRYPGADGVKTGTTAAAGRCLIASASRDDRRLLVVLLGAPDRYGDAARLLDWGFGRSRLITVAAPGVPLAAIPVRRGEQGEVELTVRRPLQAAVLAEDTTRMKVTLWVPQAVSAPVRRGQALGRVTLQEDEEVVGEELLVATRNVARRSLARLVLKFVLPLLRVLGRLGVGRAAAPVVL